MKYVSRRSNVSCYWENLKHSTAVMSERGMFVMWSDTHFVYFFSSPFILHFLRGAGTLPSHWSAYNSCKYSKSLLWGSFALLLESVLIWTPTALNRKCVYCIWSKIRSVNVNWGWAILHWKIILKTLILNVNNFSIELALWGHFVKRKWAFECF